MLHMKNLGVTKGDAGFKIQPPSVCSPALFLFLCVFSSTEVNPGNRESKKAVQCEPDQQAPVTFYWFFVM